MSHIDLQKKYTKIQNWKVDIQEQRPFYTIQVISWSLERQIRILGAYSFAFEANNVSRIMKL